MINHDQDLTAVMTNAIEEELLKACTIAQKPGLKEMVSMLAYHMGWEGEGAGPNARGKRLRPQLVLLTAIAAGGDWSKALPAAAAVELIHNFSLVHDDIQDQSPLRRGRLTVWQLWGSAQAINVGDALFSLALLALNRLNETVSLQVTMEAHQFLQETCLRLTQGQYLDMAYQERADLTMEDYWLMVEGKTAALFSACTYLGALTAGASQSILENYRLFGHYLGLAFQVQDDLLGIWGNSVLTGKSTESDLLTRKKSLPVLYGLTQRGAFHQRWFQGPIISSEITSTASMLETEGALAYTQEMVKSLAGKALLALREAKPTIEGGDFLIGIVKQLSNRQS